MSHECKSCAENVTVPGAVLQKLLLEMEAKQFDIVSGEVYEARLQTCESCPSLQYGTTCAYSGCLVRYRAKFKEKSCPAPGTPKWGRV